MGRVFSKVMWVGRATIFLVGLAVILTLVFGTLSVAVAHSGSAGLFHLDHNNNVATALTKLTGNLSTQVLKIDNNGSGPALYLEAGTDRAPLRVNAAAGTATGLSADELDGKDSSELAPRGYAQIAPARADFLTPGSSKGVIDIDRTSPGDVYCFNLSFTPETAVASAHINNNATAGTVVGSGVPSACPADHRDAAAKTYGANDSTVHNDVSFGIVFI